MRNEQKALYNKLSLIFCISVILMLGLYYGNMAQYGAPYYIGGSDDLKFELEAEYFVYQGYLLPNELTEESNYSFFVAAGFVWILAWIMRFSEIFGGYHTIAYRVLNIYFLIAIGILVYKYFSRHYDFTHKRNSALLFAVALFPNALYISVHVFRDTIITFFLFSVFYLWDWAFREKNHSRFALQITASVITSLLAYMCYWIRAQNLIFIVAIVLINVYLKDNVLSRKSIWSFLGLCIAASYLVFVSDTIMVFEKFNETYNSYLTNLNEGFSRVIFSMELFPYGFLLRMILGLISPLPLYMFQPLAIFDNFDTFFQILISIGVIAQIYMLPYLIMNVKQIDKVTVVFLVFFLAIVLTTFTFRHFIMLYPFMAIMIFRQYFEKGNNTKKLLFFLVTGFMLIAISVYLIIKR